MINYFHFRNLSYFDLLEDEVLVRIAKKHYKTPAQVCLRWLFQRGIVSIPRAIELKHIVENAQVIINARIFTYQDKKYFFFIDF